MKRRLLSFVMAAAVAVTSIPTGAITASASEDVAYEGLFLSEEEAGVEEAVPAAAETAEDAADDANAAVETAEEAGQAAVSAEIPEVPAAEDLVQENAAEDPSEVDTAGSDGEWTMIDDIGEDIAAEAAAEDVLTEDVPADAAEEPAADADGLIFDDEAIPAEAFEDNGIYLEDADAAEDADEFTDDPAFGPVSEAEDDFFAMEDEEAGIPAEEETDLFYAEPDEEAATEADEVLGEDEDTSDTAAALTLDELTDVHIRTAGEIKWFSFTPETAGVYRLESSGNYDTYAGVYRAMDGEVLAENDDRSSSSDDDSRANFQLDYALEAGVTYYYAVQMCYEDMIGSFEISLSYLRKAIEEVEIINDPRTTYYYGVDTYNEIDYWGLRIRVTYSDGTSEVLGGAETYSSQTSYSLQRSANGYSTTYVNDRNVLAKGTFTIRFTYLDWTRDYTCTVTDTEDVPQFSVGTNSGKLTRGQYYRFTAPETDYYTFNLTASCGAGYSYVAFYSADFSNISTDYDDDSGEKSGYQYKYRRSIQLDAGSEIFVRVYNENYSGYTSSETYAPADHSFTLSVAQAQELTDVISGTQGQYVICRFVPETSAPYQLLYGFTPGENYYSNYNFRVVYPDGTNTSLSYTNPEKPEEWNDYRYLQKFVTGELTAGETYYFILRTNGNWKAQIGQYVGEPLALDETEEITFPAGESVSRYFTAPETGYYRLHAEAEGNVYIYNNNGYYSYYSDNYNDGAGHYHDNRIIYLNARQTALFSIDPDDDDVVSCQITVSKVPYLSELTLASEPDNTEYTDLSSSEGIDFTGLKVHAVYDDGTSEDLEVNEASTRTGLRLRRSSYDIPEIDGRYASGSYDVWFNYYGRSVSCTIQIHNPLSPETYADVTPLPEGESYEGSLVYDNSNRTVTLRHSFVPETDGVYCFVLDLTSDYYDYYSGKMFGMDGTLAANLPVYTEGDAMIEQHWYLQEGKTYIYELPVRGYYLYDEESGTITYTAEISKMDIPVLSDSVYAEGAADAYERIYYGFVAEENGQASVTEQWSENISTSCNIYRPYFESYESVDYSTSTRQSAGNYYVTRTFNVTAGTFYMVQTYHYGGSSGDPVSYKIGMNTDLIDESNVTELEPGKSYQVSINNGGDRAWFSYTPETTGTYRFYSSISGTQYDTYVELYSRLTTGYDEMLDDDDDSGAEYRQFSLAYKLEAGKKYYYAAKMLSDSTVGDFLVTFEKMKTVESLEITKLPKQTYYLPLETNLDYSGIEMEAVLEDSYRETLTSSIFSNASQYTGHRAQWKLDDGQYNTYNALTEGTHTITVQYGDATASYEIDVKSLDTAAAAVETDMEYTGTLVVNDSSYSIFTPLEDGYYVVQAAMPGNYPGVTLYKGSSSCSVLTSDSFSYSGEDDTYWRGYRYVYYLTAGTQYYLRIRNNSSEENAYVFSLSQPEHVSVGGNSGFSIDPYGTVKYLVLDIEQDGYYRIENHLETGSYCYPNIYLYKNNSSVLSTGSSYNRRYDSENSFYHTITDTFASMKPGEYLLYLNNSSANENDVFTLSVDRVDTLTLPGEYQLSTDNLYQVGQRQGHLLTVPEDGTYTINITAKDNADMYAYIFDDDLDSITSNGYTYNSETESYELTLGAEMEEGKEYLLTVYNDKDVTYSITCEGSLAVESISIVTYPRQNYYYKLDNVSKDTELGYGSEIQVVYTDGDTETLSYGSTSSKTGLSYSIRLPEDARYTSAGQLMTGTYQAKVDYMGQTADLPIRVVTVTSMPTVAMDEAGQGSISVDPEYSFNSYDWGYIRFRAPEDGFYNLTLISDNSVGFYATDTNGYYSSYSGYVFNSAYNRISLDNSSTNSSSGQYYAYGTAYVKAGQSCYVKYRRSDYYKTDDTPVTLSVALASDREIKELSLNQPETVEIMDSDRYHWYSFTPEETDTYIMNIRNAEQYAYINLYNSPDASSSISSSDYYYYYNNYDRYLSYTLTAGRTYYYRINSSYSGSFDVILVRQSRAETLECITEGDIYCSTIPDYVESSFVNLKFRIGYADGTTEEMTYGYNGTTQKAYSLMGKTISYLAPLWQTDAEGNIIDDDKAEPVTFRYDGIPTVVNVIPRSISGLDSAEGSFTTETIEPNRSKYYSFTADEDGYYRFEAVMDDSTPVVTLYNERMVEQTQEYANSYSGHDVKVYQLQSGETYCLRVNNRGSYNDTADVTIEKISPAVSLSVTEYPQLKYYLGVDNRYSEDGLVVTVTYEDNSTENIYGGGRSDKTGLRMDTYLSGSSVGNHYLGGSAGDKTVYVTYMGAETSYEIEVMDSSSIPEMTLDTPVTEDLASGRDYAYVKFTPAVSGFYRYTMSGTDSDVSAEITSIVNSSSAEAASRPNTYNGNACEKVAFALAGVTYYVKGALYAGGEQTGGEYTVSAAWVDDLNEGVQTGTVGTSDQQVYQFTAPETGYYQFTLDAETAQAMRLRVFTSSLSSVTLSLGNRENSGRSYYAAKLNSGSSYLVTLDNLTADAMDYLLHVGRKPDVSSIKILTEPEKKVYYTEFETALVYDGLSIEIDYSNNTSEELAYGSRSTWGQGMSLDTSGVVRESGKLTEGTWPIVVTYIDKKATFNIEAKAFDIEEAKVLEAEKVTPAAADKGTSDFYVFTPETDSTFRLYTRNADVPVVATIYDPADNGKVVGSATGSASSPDAAVSVDLKAGQTYIVRLRALSSLKGFMANVKMHDTALFTEVTGVNIKESSVPFNEAGQTMALTLEIEPADAENKEVTWSSSDTSVATVSADGVVTAVAEGRAVITVTTADGGYTDTCDVIYDSEIPVIDAVYPGTDEKLGPAYCTLWIYAHDNTGVEKINVSTNCPDSDWQEFVLSDMDEDDNLQSVIEGPLNKVIASFADGETLELTLQAVDKGGNLSAPYTVSYVIDKKAPEIENLAGTWNETTLAVDLTWTGLMEEDVDTYAVYRKKASEPESAWKFIGSKTGYNNLADYTYSDKTVPNANNDYSYRIITSDKRGNTAAAPYPETNVTTTRINQAPVIVINAGTMVVSEDTYTLDLSGSSDDGSIVSFDVDFGDGTTDTVTGRKAEHVYTLASGEEQAAYTISVTATDNEGLTSVKTMDITVVNADEAGILVVTVTDTDGIPVKDAPVYFNMGEDTQEIINTDAKGTARFVGAGTVQSTAAENNESENITTDGMHTVGVYKEHYLPVKTSVTLINGKVNEISFVLEEKELVEGEFEVHKMTLDEIIDAGIPIDSSHPENYHVMQYNVTLKYQKLTFNSVNGGGVGQTGSSGGYYYMQPIDDDIILVLEIPVAFSILKEFFDVNLYIINNASEDFSLLENHVHLNVPEGLTVMEQASPEDVYIDTIQGQSTETVNWILRGDKEGSYPLSADYEGIISDFNKAVTARFESEKNIEVKGTSNLKLKMRIPDNFTNGEFFYSLNMSNVGDPEDREDDVYMPGINGEGELIQTTVKDAGGTVSYVDELPEVLRGEETLSRFYRITDQISEQMQQYPNYKDFVFAFREAKVREITSLGLPLEIEVVPAEELYAEYISARALPAEVTAQVTGDASYGYQSGDVKLEASAVPADNAEYDLTYTWYDTTYREIGKGASIDLPKDLPVNDADHPYHYHVLVTSTRKDNHHQAQAPYQDVKVVISPRTVELTWNGTEGLVYDGTEKQVTASVANLVGTDTCDVTVEGGTAVDAGTYTAVATALSNPNYQLPADPKVEYTIQALVAELTWSFDAAGEDAENADDDHSDPGAAAATADGDEEAADQVILRAEGEPEEETVFTKVYDGKAPSVTASVANLIAGDECAVTVTGSDQKDANTAEVPVYTATVTALGNGNYQLPAETTHTYTIEPREVTLTWSGDSDLVYNGKAKAVIATAGNVVEGDTVNVTVNGGDEVNANTETTPVYTATAAALSSTNYKLPAEVTRTYSIAPKEVRLIWSGDTGLVYDGNAKAVTATAQAEDLAAGDTVNVTVTGGDKVNANTAAVPEYTATATALDNTNYKLPAEVTHTYSIEPKEVNLIWNGDTGLVYDGNAKAVTATAKPEDLADGDTVNVTVTGGDAVNANTEAVPEYTATATALDNSNYKLPEAVTRTYSIAPKEVSLTWNGYTDLVYDGAAKNVTATADDLAAGDTVNVTVTGGDAVNANTEAVPEYTATATALDNTNYKLPAAVTRTYSIAPKEVSLIWSGDTGLVYDGTAKAVAATAKAEDLAAGDTVNVTVTGGDKVNANTDTEPTYTATATALDNTNYKLPAEATHTYSIAKLTTEITFEGNETRVYDGTASLKAVISNAAEGDDVTVVLEEEPSSAVGTHTAKVKELAGAAAANYQLPAELPETTYEITRKQLAVVWSNTDERVYDGKASAVAAAIDGLAEADKDVLTLQVEGADAVNAGTYTATASYVQSEADRTALEDRYILPEEAQLSKEYAITQREVTLTWSGDAGLVYDGTAKAVTAAAGNLAQGDTVKVTVEGGNEVNANVAAKPAYTATATALDNANYKLPAAVTHNYSIAPKEVTLTWSGNTGLVEDGTAKNVTAAAGNLVSGDTVTVTVTGGNMTAAGTYTATATALSSTNYRLPANASISYQIAAKPAPAPTPQDGGNSGQGQASGDQGQASGGQEQKAEDSAADKGQKPDTAPAAANPDGDPSDITTVAGMEQAILKMSDSAEPEGSSFSKIQVKSTKQTKSSITLTWNRVDGANGYIVYGNKCGKGNNYEKLGEVTKAKFVHKGLEKGTFYKFSVVAYKLEGGVKKIIASGKTVHISTKGGKTTNISKVKLNKKKVTLKKGKSFKLKVTTFKKIKSLKLKTHRKIKYESSDTSVAMVTSKGKIKAKGKGTCYVYAYAQDGVYARIKVKVK